MTLSRRQLLHMTAVLAAVASGERVTAQSPVATSGTGPDFSCLRFVA